MKEKQFVVISTGTLVRAAIVIALVFALYQISQFILVLIAAIIIASAVEPAAVWARRNGLPRLPTVIAVYIGTALALLVFFYFLLLPLIGEVLGFIRTLNVYSGAIMNDSVLSGMFASQNMFGGLDTPQIVTQVGDYLNSFYQFLSKGIFSSFSTFVGGVMNFILIIVLSFYLAVQQDGIAKFLGIIVPEKHEGYIVGLWKRAQIKIGRWMQGQLFLGVIVMALVYVSLIIIGVPHALLLAVLAGLFELIPLFGPVLAAIPAVFVAYASLGPTTAGIVAVLYVVIQQLENHIIYPLVVKKVVGVHPIVSIMALVVGGHLAGFLGVLVAVPVATILMEFISDLEESKFKHQSLEAHS